MLGPSAGQAWSCKPRRDSGQRPQAWVSPPRPPLERQPVWGRACLSFGEGAEHPKEGVWGRVTYRPAWQPCHLGSPHLASATILERPPRAQHGLGLILGGGGSKSRRERQFPTQQIHTGAVVPEAGAQTAPPDLGLGPETWCADNPTGNLDSSSPMTASHSTNYPPPTTCTLCEVGAAEPSNAPAVPQRKPPTHRDPRGLRVAHMPGLRTHRSLLPPGPGTLRAMLLVRRGGSPARATSPMPRRPEGLPRLRSEQPRARAACP